MVERNTERSLTMNSPDLEKYKFPENEDEWRVEFAKYVPAMQAQDDDELREAAATFLEVNPKCEMEVDCLI